MTAALPIAPAPAVETPYLFLGRYPIYPRFRLTLFIQLSIQLILLLYMSLYVPLTRAALFEIVFLVMFAFAVDFAASIYRYGNWQANFGPIPVVFSANLFVWFLGSHSYLAFLAVAVGVSSKHLVQRGGRHVFNPSAIGVCVASIPCLLIPGRFGEVDLAHRLNAPPNMLELTLLLALISMVRVPVVLTTLGAFFTANYLLSPFQGGMYVPAVMWTPIFLGITLLITDPATTPKKPLGQLVFGALFIVAFSVLATGLRSMHIPEFWAKMLPIPIANLLSPSIDRAVTSVEARLGKVWAWAFASLQPRWNLVHVGVWIFIAVSSFLSGGYKDSLFDGDIMKRDSQVHLVLDEDGRATCARNPVFCTPFSFEQELEMWSRGAPTAHARNDTGARMSPDDKGRP
jgi:hypothetical protein